ncbi:TRAM domain-containing protein [Candidatus Woesearchaeota archaeon]|nr:TRAM domain-containing protein [Candidatus Woesearchaeota archaeon]
MVRNFKEKVAPVREGDTLEVTVEGVGGRGDGIAKVNGFVVFVPNTRKGDKVRIKLTKVLDNFGFGEVVGQIKESTGTTEPKRKDPATEEEFDQMINQVESGETQEKVKPKPVQPPPEPNPKDSEDFGEEPEEPEDFM